MQAGDRVEFIEPFDGEWRIRSDMEHMYSRETFRTLYDEMYATFSGVVRKTDKLLTSEKLISRMGQNTLTFVDLPMRVLFEDGSYLYIVLDDGSIHVEEHDDSGILGKSHRYDVDKYGRVIRGDCELAEWGAIIVHHNRAEVMDSLLGILDLVESEWDRDTEVAGEIFEGLTNDMKNGQLDTRMKFNNQPVSIEELEQLAKLVRSATPWSPVGEE
jgi:hypothetical protein